MNTDKAVLLKMQGMISEALLSYGGSASHGLGDPAEAVLTPEDVAHRNADIAGDVQENVRVMLLDTKQGLRDMVTVHRGTVNSAPFRSSAQQFSVSGLSGVERGKLAT